MRHCLTLLLCLLLDAGFLAAQTTAHQPIRARDLEVPFDGTPGPLNAITDVEGVQVGATTLIKGDGPLKTGEGPVRTGVTVVLPRGTKDNDPVYAGWFSLNGNGEMTGTTWVEESGFLEGPVAITNTHSVGTVRDAMIAWGLKHGALAQPWSLPVVAETWDGYLNDINGFHVKPEDVFAALDSARGGAVAEGNTGGGTGMVCYGFKGGTGTASRVVAKDAGGYTVGVLVQCNCGRRPQLTIAGVPVGKEIPQDVPYASAAPQDAMPGSETAGDVGSIIIVVATDAPLLPHQLKRLARRAALGLARTGSTSGNGSGDIFLAFSTANPHADAEPGPNAVKAVSNERISPLFTATVEATEEAIVNAMVGAKTMTGIDGHTVIALPHEGLKAALKISAMTACMSTRFMIGPMLTRRKFVRLTTAAACFAALAAACFSQGTAAPNSPIDAFTRRFNAELMRHGVVGGGYAIAHAADPAQASYFGDASRDPHRPVDADTAYNWASITKTMTAIAILQLRDRGQLSLDDPAVRYVPELREIHDAYGPIEAITIRHLLTHSAGFRNPTWPWDCDDTANCDWQPFEPTRWAQVAAMLPYTHIAFAPGSRWSYSNLGYVFLGQIIERLSGDDFEVYLDKNILKPLGMTASYFDRAPYFLAAHVSASYMRAGAKLTPQPLDFDTGITTSNSGLKAPIPDMVKYLRFLIGDPSNPVYDVVLKRSSLEEAWTGVLPAIEPGQAPTAYTAGPHGSHPKMGLGFFVVESGGRRYIYHDGDQGGFSSELLIDPSGKSASILVVNTTDSGVEAAAPALHPQSNTEPDASTDLRQALRTVLIESVFPALAKSK